MPAFRSINAKLTVVTVFVIALAISVNGWLYYQQADSVVINSNNRTMSSDLRRLDIEMDSMIELGRKHAIQLSQSRIASQLLQSWQGEQAWDQIAESRKHLIHEFMAVLNASQYFQVRLIDAGALI